MECKFLYFIRHQKLRILQPLVDHPCTTDGLISPWSLVCSGFLPSILSVLYVQNSSQVFLSAIRQLWLDGMNERGGYAVKSPYMHYLTQCTCKQMTDCTIVNTPQIGFAACKGDKFT